MKLNSSLIIFTLWVCTCSGLGFTADNDVKWKCFKVSGNNGQILSVYYYVTGRRENINEFKVYNCLLISTFIR